MSEDNQVQRLLLATELQTMLLSNLDKRLKALDKRVKALEEDNNERLAE